MHLAVFDIDGTLVDSDEFDGLLYAEAVMSILGREIDRTWSTYANVTDSGILDEILEQSGLSRDRQEIHLAVKAEFVRLTEDHVARTPGTLREIPGAKALIDMLRQQPSVTVAIATGGWRETAELKLRGIGLEPENIPLATASDHSDRCAIIELAERRALNGSVAQARTYFGDGLWDKEAAAKLKYSFVAVGSGVTHDIVLPDLLDHEKILAHLRI